MPKLSGRTSLYRGLSSQDKTNGLHGVFAASKAALLFPSGFGVWI